MGILFETLTMSKKTYGSLKVNIQEGGTTLAQRKEDISSPYYIQIQND